MLSRCNGKKEHGMAIYSPKAELYLTLPSMLRVAGLCVCATDHWVQAWCRRCAGEKSDPRDVVLFSCADNGWGARDAHTCCLADGNRHDLRMWHRSLLKKWNLNLQLRLNPMKWFCERKNSKTSSDDGKWVMLSLAQYMNDQVFTLNHSVMHRNNFF